MAKEAVLTVKLESELRDAFAAEAEALDRPASQLIREFMREFVERQRASRAHEAWFRTEVRRAMKAEDAGQPHDAVMRKARAAVDRVAQAKKRPQR